MSDQTAELPQQELDPGLTAIEFSFLATDEELQVLLSGAPAALDGLFAEGAAPLAPPVAGAVKRSLVARRALAPEAGEDGLLEPLEPWASLASALIDSELRCRISSDDPRDDLLVLTDPTGVVSVRRDPTAINTVTFSGPDTTVDIVVDRLLELSTQPTADDVVPGPAVEVTGADLDAGVAALSINDLETAKAALGDAYGLVIAAGAVHRVEITRSSDAEVHGVELSFRDAGDLGWVQGLPAPEPGSVTLHHLDDDGLRAAIAAASQD